MEEVIGSDDEEEGSSANLKSTPSPHRGGTSPSPVTQSGDQEYADDFEDIDSDEVRHVGGFTRHAPFTHNKLLHLLSFLCPEHTHNLEDIASILSVKRFLGEVQAPCSETSPSSSEGFVTAHATRYPDSVKEIKGRSVRAFTILGCLYIIRTLRRS